MHTPIYDKNELILKSKSPQLNIFNPIIECLINQSII